MEEQSAKDVLAQARDRRLQLSLRLDSDILASFCNPFWLTLPGLALQVRLLLVHGNLSAYRLSRLIKYSFYKNIIFGLLLFYYQFYNGFSGQALVDGISAAAYNVVFTSIPILLFAVLDRPVVSLCLICSFTFLSLSLHMIIRCPDVWTHDQETATHTSCRKALWNHEC